MQIYILGFATLVYIYASRISVSGTHIYHFLFFFCNAASKINVTFNVCFSKSNPTLMPVVDGTKFGQIVGLSPWDVHRVNKLYKCEIPRHHNHTVTYSCHGGKGKCLHSEGRGRVVSRAMHILYADLTLRYPRSTPKRIHFRAAVENVIFHVANETD